MSGKMNDILEQIACGFVGALLGYLLVEVFFPIPKGM